MLCDACGVIHVVDSCDVLRAAVHVICVLSVVIHRCDACGAIHVVCFMWCDSCGAIHVVCLVLCDSFGVVHLV